MSSVETVALHALIGAPEMYDGVRVRVLGFCSIEFEGSAIWVAQEHYDDYITKNAIWLAFEDFADHLSLHEKVLVIEGTFSANKLGHKGMFSGAIEQITRIEPHKG